MICLVTDRRVFAGDASGDEAAVDEMLAAIGACA